MDARRFLRHAAWPALKTLILGLSLAPAVPAHGQNVQEHSDRLDRLVELRARLEAAADSASRAMARTEALDSAQVGRLRLYFLQRRRDVVIEAADSANRLLETTLGSEAVILDDLLIAVGFSDEAVAAPERPDKTTLTIDVSRATPDAVPRTMLLDASRWVSDQVDSTFTNWIGLSMPVVDTTIAWEELWVEFATPASTLVASCERGDEPECLVALGIIPVENPALDWYDAEGRHELVRRLPYYRMRDHAAFDVCLDREWDQICIDILEQHTVAAPLSHIVRRGLLKYALAQSPGGFGRLLAAADSAGQVGDVLSAVAQQDLPSFLRDWRARVASSRPDGASIRWPTAATTVVWIGILLSLRLGASRRWRANASSVRPS